MGAIGELCEVWNWEAQGTMTPQECAEAMWAMWQDVGVWDMIGSIAYFGTAALPADYLPCDGSTHDRVDYPALYAVLDASLIVDADHFKTPPIVDAFIVGAGSTYATGDVGGEAEHTLTLDESPEHNHEYMEKSEILFPYGTLTPDISARGTLLESGRNTSDVGGGLAHNNLPPFWAGLVGIRWR